MTLHEVRRLAMSLPEVTEEPHFDYTSFRVHGKIFATALPEGEFLHVFVADEEREAALAAEPDFVEPLRWGGQTRGLRILLSGAKPRVVDALLRQAWSRRAPERQQVSGILTPVRYAARTSPPTTTRPKSPAASPRRRAPTGS